MQRFFTLAQAEAALAGVKDLMRRITSLKESLDHAEGELRAEAERIRLSGGALARHDRLTQAGAARDAAAVQLRSAISAIQETGCLVKDLDTGLLDFPTLFHGQEVYLCWKLGEQGIAFWHGVEEGYRGRKPIDREFLDHHRGEE